MVLEISRLIHSIISSRVCKNNKYAVEIKSLAHTIRTPDFYVENPNWVKNYGSELDLIKHYESRNYKKLRFPPQISPT